MDGKNQKRSPSGKRAEEIQSPRSAFKRVRQESMSENTDGNAASSNPKRSCKGKERNKDSAGTSVRGHAKDADRRRKTEAVNQAAQLVCTEEVEETPPLEAHSDSEPEENSVNGEQERDELEDDDQEKQSIQSEDCEFITNLKTYKRGKVDLTSKWYLLTFPACSASCEEILSCILRRYQNLACKAVAVREFHAGHKIWKENAVLKRRLMHDVDSVDSANCQMHIHVLIGFNLNERRGLRIRNCRAFDVDEYHPNIRTVSVGTEGNVLDYVMKYFMLTTEEERQILKRYGWQYSLFRVAFPEDRMLFNRKGPGQTRITSELQLFLDAHDEGRTLKDLTNEYPDMKAWVFKNGAKIVAYSKLVPSKVKLSKTWELPKGTSAASTSIIKWLSDNVRKARAIRQKQLWITTPPGCGKSTFKNALCERLHCYLPPSETFDTLYNDEVEMIILDEFTGNQKSCEWIKSIADGSNYALKRKCLPDFVKKVNVPFIVLSNYFPRDCPHWNIDSVQLQAIEDRFEIIYMTTFLPSF